MSQFEFPLQFKKQYAAPLDVDIVFSTTSDRLSFLISPIRYAGQIVSDLETEKCYQLSTNTNSWIEIGGESLSLLNSLSANLDSVYTTVNNNFLPLSGGTLTGNTMINANLTVYGDISATGNSYFSNTVYSTTSALSVVNIGNMGPALYVANNGTGDLASFYDIDVDPPIEVLHIGGHNGDFPNVGVKTSAPNKDFTVKGEISASNTIWDASGNSNNWNYAYLNQTNFLPLSGGSMTGSLTVVGNISATQNYFSGSNKSVFTPQTNTIGVSAISNIVAVSVLPITPDPSTLYIVI